MCVLIAFPNLSGTLLFETRIQQIITTNVVMSSSKLPVNLVRFQLILNFLDRFSENFQASSSMKTHPLKPSFSIRTDGRADRRRERRVEVISCFQKFCERASK